MKGSFEKKFVLNRFSTTCCTRILQFNSSLTPHFAQQSYVVVPVVMMSDLATYISTLLPSANLSDVPDDTIVK